MSELLAIECFSCSGGMAEGFRRAGVTFDWVFDFNADACASYEQNLGHRPVQMDVRDLLRMAKGGWGPGRTLDLLVADPPCTPWSRAGKRLGVDDERDMLKATCELIRLLRPRAYLIGNVPGLDDATQWKHLQRALAPLRQEGYCIADYTSLDAADFGVPQHRVRPFWFGHLEGPCVRWPMPTHGRPSCNSSLAGVELKPWVTCREALGHLPLEQLGKPCRVRYRAALATTDAQRNKAGKKPRASRLDEPAETVRATADAVLTGNAKHPMNRLDAPSYTVTTKGDGRGAQGACVLRLEDPNRPPASAAAPHRTIGTTRDQAVLEWPWPRPATTVTTRAGLAPPGHHPESGSIMSQPNAVVLTERAAAILQGFPETWAFKGETKKARWSQIGQAMPPALAHGVAVGVVEQLCRSREISTAGGAA